MAVTERCRLAAAEADRVAEPPGAGRAQVQTAADGWALAHPNTDPELALVTRVLELRAPEPAMELED